MLNFLQSSKPYEKSVMDVLLRYKVRSLNVYTTKGYLVVSSLHLFFSLIEVKKSFRLLISPEHQIIII